MNRAIALSCVLFACCATGTTASGVEADATMVLQDVGVRGSDASSPPGLTEAVAAVWASYGRIDAPPHILLVTGADLSCTDPNSLNPGFAVLMASGPDCREGFTLLPFAVSVAYRGQPWSQSALAHEMQHAALIRELRGSPIGDPTHALDVWQAGGAVASANAALAAKGQ